MESAVVWKLKMLNRVILKRRLLFNQQREFINRKRISKRDIADLRIALHTSESFDQAFELIDIM